MKRLRVFCADWLCGGDPHLAQRSIGAPDGVAQAASPSMDKPSNFAVFKVFPLEHSMSCGFMK